MGRVVLVTGVSHDLGGRVARRLADDPAVDRVIGVDVIPPYGDLADTGSVQFVRADIRNPVIAKVLAAEDVDTVVHTSVLPSHGGAGSRASTKEHNVIGTMQLLAACQRAPGIERLVVRSSAEVYGSSSRDPAMFTEDMAARRTPRSGFAKDVIEVEGYIRGFARRRPDITVTTLRTASVVGPSLHSAATEYFRLPVVPKPLGFDARIQLLHAEDLLAVLHHATLAGVAGTFNVAGDGVMTLTQAIRRLGRPVVPVPSFALVQLGSLLRPTGVTPGGLSPDGVRFMAFGRGVDTTRMREVLGFHPRFTTEAAFADFARSLRPGMVAGRHPVAVLEGLLTNPLGVDHG
jgi:UDP-glucose 4-epimerase